MNFTSTPKAGHSASIVWSISFGDLLTLLVCFFLVLTPWEKLNMAQDLQENQLHSTIPRDLDIIGTNFAPSSTPSKAPNRLRRDGVVGVDRTVVLKAEVPLFKSQVGEVSLHGLELMVASLHREIPSVVTKHSVVLLRLCGEETAVESVAPMVGRVLKEIGVDERQLVVSYPTVACDEVATMRPVTATIVGSVTVLQEQVPKTT